MLDLPSGTIMFPIFQRREGIQTETVAMKLWLAENRDLVAAELWFQLRQAYLASRKLRYDPSGSESHTLDCSIVLGLWAEWEVVAAPGQYEVDLD